MDPFSNLPSLVQSEILIHLQSEIRIKKVIQASPSLLCHFLTFKKSVLRRILNDILYEDASGDLLRDALGIIYISDKASAENYLETKMWMTMNVLGTLEKDQLERLWHLFSRLIIFIEDYASKATSVYLPRAYLGIPDILNGSGSYFKGHKLETKVIRFKSLTSTERYRFLSAFAKHELLCKIYPPQRRHFEELIAMEEQLLAMSKHSDLTMMQSVQEYYKCVYGALFAHCQESWLPDIPEPTKTEQSYDKNIPKISRFGLLFPDNTYFSAEAYEEDMEIYRRCLASDLPGFGLDCLSQILLFMNKEAALEPILKAWLKKITHRFYRTWICRLPESLSDKELRHYNQPLTNQVTPTYDEPEDEETEDEETEDEENGIYLGDWLPPWLTSIEHRHPIYRQRARGLFDNDRLYPKYGNHFPTLDQLARRMEEHKKTLSPDVERSRRRSQKWQDYWASRIRTPFEQQCEEEDDKVSIKGHIGSCVRFFAALSSKLPIM
ncbi:hypothetical protein F52700_5130 [Fusarium sp. NRRL 52700]|nr:hypothetical protein F52700_5130 [Fusarium sp. NRRL 52700]